jgi:hypothetical protein
VTNKIRLSLNNLVVNPLKKPIFHEMCNKVTKAATVLTNKVEVHNPMENSKHRLQSRLEQWKSAASQLISGSETQEEATIELDPVMLEKCQRQAHEQHTTVSAVIHNILEQYWSNINTESKQPPISRDQLERNPLLYLDGLSKRNFQSYGGDVQDEE